MALDFNVSPYYDDFDPKKEFYRILFKPGFAVQARELTQLQTILGNQISEFAKNIFAEGSVVTGASHQLDDSSFYLKCQSTYNNGTSTVNVDFSNFVGNYIVETTTGKIGYVKKYTASNASDPATLHVSIVKGPQTPFNDNTNFYVIQNTNSNIAINYFTSVTSGSSGTSLLFHIGEGVFYADSTFLYCPEQTVVVGKYTKTPSAVIGLNIVESISDYVDDSSLLDPALGASNYLAPGADRYKIDLELTTQPYTLVAQTYPNFIQLSVVVNGVLIQDVTTPIYSEIMDTMAKRTYDTNGDFIVKNFIPNIVNNTQDNTSLILQVGAGSAFVQGYEIETISPTIINLQKAQTTTTDTGYSVNTTYGNYTYVSGINGSLPTINTNYSVEIHSVKTNQSASTKIGTALIKSIEYVSGFGRSTVFAMFLDKISMSSGTFTSARSFVNVGSGSYANPQFEANVDGSAFDTTGTQAQLFLADSNQLLFELPRTYVSSLQNVNYYYKQYFTGTVSGNTVSITCKSTDSFVGYGSGLNVIENYIIVETNSGNFIPADNVSVTLSSTYQATINFGSNLYNGHTVNIIASVHTQADTYRTKTLVSNYVGTPITITDRNAHDIGKSDVFQLSYVYEYPSTSLFRSTWSSSTSYNSGDVVLSGNTAYISTAGSNVNNNPTSGTNWTQLTNNVSYYTLDNGQRDTYYDHGTITRASVPNTSINALPIFSYFTHSGSGYISSQSYPISTIGYGSIPTYTSPVSNQLYNLRDCIDFRPRRNDDEVVTFTFANHQIPETITNADVVTDITYYLGRVDKVILTRDGLFKVLQGVPSYLNPQPPTNQSDSMTLFVLNYTPYTSSPADVTTQIVPHKRYTMKDISGIDNRLTNIEYYTALSVLEAQVNSQTLTGNNGTALFKNGFIADAFTGSGVGDVTNVEYRSSIDYSNNLARPLYLSNNTKLNYLHLSSNTAAGNSVWSSLVTVPYSETTFVNQPIASGTISANPFGVVAYVGTLKITPESDIWFDINTAPSVIVNTGGQNDNYQYYASVETQWNAWQSIWTGEAIAESTGTTPAVSGALSTSALGAQSVAIAPGVTTSTANFVVNQSVVPYARSIRIDFEANGLSPNTQMHMYINGLNMTNYMYPYSISANTGHSSVISDASGSVSGYIMFPNDNSVKFLTGKETIIICDNGSNLAQSTTYAQATFYSQGLLETLSPLLVSTKPNSRVIGQLQLNATGNDPSTTGSIVNTIPTPPKPPASYLLTSDYKTIRQGNTINFVFTTQNVPPGRTYNANISGTITNTNLGDGFTLGNTVIRTVGTLSQSQAVLSIPILEGTITNYQNKYIVLEVDVPADPQYGAAAQYFANVAIQSDVVSSYSVQANSYVVAGNTIYFNITGSNLASNANIAYAVTGTASGQFTANVGSTTSGYININSPSGTNTLIYTINSAYTPVGSDNFTVTYTLPDGTTRAASVPITSNKMYSLNANVTSQVSGNTFLLTLNTQGVANGTNVPYTIGGVTTSQINGASLTGNFSVLNNTANLAITTTSSAISSAVNFGIGLNSITPAVYANVAISVPPVATPAVPNPTPVVQPVVNLPSSVVAGSSYTWSITNGPKNGTFTWANLNTGQISQAYGLDVNGNYTSTTPFTNVAGSYQIYFAFSGAVNNVTKNLLVTAAVVTPTYTVSAPSTINDGDTFTIGVTSSGVSTSTPFSFTIANPGNYWITSSSATNATVTTAGQPNYAAYVDNYGDLIAAYNDAQNGTTYYAQNYPGNPTLGSVQDEINAYNNNTSFFPYAKQSKAAWGQYHWNTFGKNENRTLPITSVITASCQISDTNPVAISFLLNPIHGSSESSGTITAQFGAPVGQTKVINVNHTAASLLVIPPAAPVTPAQTGDFIDSPLTIAQAVGQYSYYLDLQPTPGYAYRLQDPNAQGKIWINTSQQAEANTVANAVAAYYRNPSILNRNPDLAGLLYWTNQIISLQWASNQTQPAWYPVNSSAWQTQDTTGFNSNYGVWLNPGTDPLVGQTTTVYRIWNCPASGQYTMILGADDYAAAYLDIGGPWGGGTPALTFDTSVAYPPSLQYAQANGITGAHGGSNGPLEYWVSGSTYVPAGMHLLRFDVRNNSFGNDTWATNPGFFAAAIYSGVVSSPVGQTPIWDTRSQAAAQSVPVGPGLSYSDALASAESSFNTWSASKGEPIGSRTQFVSCTTDPLSQTFFVPAGAYPNGVFLTGLSLYFSSVDSQLPVFAQIRPTVNGYPSSDTVIPLTTVWMNPYEIETSTDGSVETFFGFTDPVYLAPGQYAIVVGSNSTNYQLYYATVGQQQIGSTNIVSAQPNVGVLFKSKNASTWIADESSDLSFKLYQAQFSTNKTYEAVFNSSAPDSSFYFDVVDITTQELDFNNTTSITYSMKNQIDGTFDSSFTPLLANQNVNLKATRNNTAYGDTVVKAELITTDTNVSPVIDLDRVSMIMINNVISSKSQQNIPETTYTGGDAAAKYVTRAVTLASGFDAQNISVFFDANMQSGTSIEVYVKVLAADDTDTFANKSWIQVPNASSTVTYSSSYSDFMEQEYTLSGINYVSSGVTYRNFQTFAVKVVMYSNSSAIVPQFQNFRAIATS